MLRAVGCVLIEWTCIERQEMISFQFAINERTKGAVKIFCSDCGGLLFCGSQCITRRKENVLRCCTSARQRVVSDAESDGGFGRCNSIRRM